MPPSRPPVTLRTGAPGHADAPALDEVLDFFFFPHTFCEQYTAVPVCPSAPTSYGCLRPRGEATGSRGVEPPCVLQDFMHSRFAGSGSNCLEGELEQGAGKGPLRCHGDDATPAGHVGCTQS